MQPISGYDGYAYHHNYDKIIYLDLIKEKICPQFIKSPNTPASSRFPKLPKLFDNSHKPPKLFDNSYKPPKLFDNSHKSSIDKSIDKSIHKYIEKPTNNSLFESNFHKINAPATNQIFKSHSSTLKDTEPITNPLFKSVDYSDNSPKYPLNMLDDSPRLLINESPKLSPYHTRSNSIDTSDSPYNLFHSRKNSSDPANCQYNLFHSKKNSSDPTNSPYNLFHSRKNSSDPANCQYNLSHSRKNSSDPANCQYNLSHPRKNSSDPVNHCIKYIDLLTDDEIAVTIEKSYELYKHPLLLVYIEKLPIFLYQEIQRKIYEACPITQEDFEDDSKVIMLPCDHYFHPTGIKEWLRKSTKCPMCRYDLVTNL